MRSLSIAIFLGMMSACVFFDDGGHTCVLNDRGAGIAEPAPQRDPESLTCQSRSSPCDPACGPCPETAFAPEVTWGVCGSPCEQLGETECAADPSCRVVKDARCAVSGSCPTDFLGCFPTDTFTDPTIACSTVTDGWSCSRSNTCTALHRNDPCPVDGACVRSFAMCIVEGSNPGRCHEQAICRAVSPTCSPGSTAGVANGCWTGACIPNDICEP
jgi:hypothetical protein